MTAKNPEISGADVPNETAADPMATEENVESITGVPAVDDTPPINKEYEPNYREIAQRTAAEFDNYRKRVMKERKEWQRDVLARFLKEFFPAFDDLDRTIAENEKANAPENLVAGVKMARANLWKTLENAGVKEIQAKHKKFDPRYHEAVATVPTAEIPAGNVFEVLQTGYLIEDFTLRPARVVVAAEIPATNPSTGTEN